MPIGGYLELELPQGKEYHESAIKLNTGRNAFEYVLRAKNYKKVYLPYYTCDVMLEPIKKLEIAFEFYHIDKTFRPIFDFSEIHENEVFVYNNYFGICDIQLKEVANICQNLIIDNSQAFFSKPLPNVDTFYSPRKYFGVPDGAYLYTNKKLKVSLEKDVSYERMLHLVGRIDIGPEQFYESFKEHSASLVNQPIKIMSNLTKRLLESIDYEKAKEIRRENFIFLHKTLKETNKLDINMETGTVPMIYPYLMINSTVLRSKLILKKIFLPTYWANVIDCCNKEDLEYKMARFILPLPVDHRYNKNHMSKILALTIYESYNT